MEKNDASVVFLSIYLDITRAQLVGACMYAVDSMECL